MPGSIPQPTYIYRIAHYSNLEFILHNGLCCPNHEIRDPNYMNIGHRTLIDSRGLREVPIAPFGVLNDYVPFYFTKKSPMLYVISKHNVPDYTGGQGEIIYLVSSAQDVAQANIPFVFTNRHSKIGYAEFRNNLKDLSIIDWDVIKGERWNNTPTEYDRQEKKQAEFLVHQRMPIELVRGIACFNDKIFHIIQQTLLENNKTIPVRKMPSWYY